MSAGAEHGAPPLAGVVGWPVAHSRSPVLHGHWLRRYGIAGYYVPIGLPPERFAEGLHALRLVGFVGVNVTVPNKEAALALASEVSPRAAAIGAANTLSFLPGGGLHAENTDVHGFLASLRQGAPRWSAAAGPALVLGAGGAARAIVAGLIEEGCPEIRLANRTRERADRLADHFGPRVAPVDWAEASAAMDGARTIVNTTTLGMAGQGELDVSLQAAPAEAVVNDIVYTPLETPLLRAARRRGLVAVDGLGMLLHQAAPGFQRWFGVRPAVDAELRAAVLAA